jgi:phosphoribosylaminoimidazole-succinocarboxamide synthase
MTIVNDVNQAGYTVSGYNLTDAMQVDFTNTNDTVSPSTSIILVDRISESKWLYDVKNVSSGQISFAMDSDFMRSFQTNGTTKWFV